MRLRPAILILALALPLALPMGREAVGGKHFWLLPAFHSYVRGQASPEQFEQLIEDTAKGIIDGHIHEVTPKKRETALHWAARDHPNPEVIDILIDAGAEVDARSNTGFTPLHYAARSKNPRGIVPALLDAGADPNARSNNGLTPLHLAVRNSHQPGGFVETLVNAGAKVNVKSKSGYTPLHYVVIAKEPMEAARALLRAGADKDAKDNKGKSVLDYAKEEGLPADVIQILE